MDSNRYLVRANLKSGKGMAYFFVEDVTAVVDLEDRLHVFVDGAGSFMVEPPSPDFVDKWGQVKAYGHLPDEDGDDDEDDGTDDEFPTFDPGPRF